MKKGWIGSLDFRAYKSNGQLDWEELNVQNGLADEGEYMILDMFLRNGTSPTTFYLRLFNDTPEETDALSNLIGEPTTNGYSAQQITRDTIGWPSLTLDAGDYQATSIEVQFDAIGGSWGPVTHSVLATTSDNTGKLIAYAALSQPRTIEDGGKLLITYKVKLS